MPTTTSSGRRKYLIDAEGSRLATRTSARASTTHRGPDPRAACRGRQGRDLGDKAKAAAAIEPRTARTVTPETYLGATRAQGFVNGPIAAGTQNFGAPPRELPGSTFAYSGRWKINDRSRDRAVRPIDASICTSTRVACIWCSASPGPRDGSVDGRARRATARRRVKVTRIRQRLYTLVDLDAVEDHRLTLRVAPGVSGYRVHVWIGALMRACPDRGNKYAGVDVERKIKRADADRARRRRRRDRPRRRRALPRARRLSTRSRPATGDRARR